jgi:hypothetical protein
LKPGVAATAAAAVGFVATLVSLALVFVPPAGTENVLNYEVNLVGQAVIIIGVGGILFWRSRHGQAVILAEASPDTPAGPRREG